VDWYYAVGNERFGPFDQDAFDQLVDQGRITGVTLVWRDGLDDWVQYQFLTAPTPGTADDVPPVLVQCSQCRRQAASDDMVQYQGHWVCAECKDTFYQRVREGSFSTQDPAGTRRYRFAGFWIRFGAEILDLLIVFVVLVALLFMVGMFIVSAPGASGVMVLLFYVLMIGFCITYATCFLGKCGATPGKMACGLKVIVSDGRSVSYARAFGRAWALALSFLIPYIAFAFTMGLTAAFVIADSGMREMRRMDDVVTGAMVTGLIAGAIAGVLMSFPFYMAGLTRQKCTLHDFICNTRVVHAK